MTDPRTLSTKKRLILGVLLLGILTYSGIHPYDRPTWFLEVFPVMVALPLLWATSRRYPLTPLLYYAIFAHALVLIVGGHDTYARVPLGFTLAKWFNLSRNPYDRIGHFFQGAVPALIAREIFIRGNYIRTRRMRIFLILCAVLAISATYELFEWATALVFGQGAEEFLGTQGDPWDTQWDMFMALVGATSSLLFLSRQHDRQLARFNSTSSTESSASPRCLK